MGELLAHGRHDACMSSGAMPRWTRANHSRLTRRMPAIIGQ